MSVSILVAEVTLRSTLVLFKTYVSLLISIIVSSVINKIPKLKKWLVFLWLSNVLASTGNLKKLATLLMGQYKSTLGKGHGSDNLSRHSGSGPPIGANAELRPSATRLTQSIKAPDAHKRNSLPLVSVDDVYLTLGRITLTRGQIAMTDKPKQ